MIRIEYFNGKFDMVVGKFIGKGVPFTNIKKIKRPFERDWVNIEGRDPRKGERSTDA